ncbi:MAG: DUF2924 domain-containing protein [Magnetococcales bacterium]|nr:DUF2924 domain-containing protein [Magnetococcales bacterium]
MFFGISLDRPSAGLAVPKVVKPVLLFLCQPGSFVFFHVTLLKVAVSRRVTLPGKEVNPGEKWTLTRSQPGPGNAPAKPEVATPAPGARLIREWQGVEYVVTVLDDGFEYQGRKFKSLSSVAKAITGTHWSGPLFFGLRKGGKA